MYSRYFLIPLAKTSQIDHYNLHRCKKTTKWDKVELLISSQNKATPPTPAHLCSRAIVFGGSPQITDDRITVITRIPGCRTKRRVRRFATLQTTHYGASHLK